jgi:hypothetical protein
MQSNRIDRIIIQQCLCQNALCEGIGVFDNFFQGFFGSVIDAFNPGIPIYIRFDKNKNSLSPLYLTSQNQDGFINVGSDDIRSKFIELKPYICSDRFILMDNSKLHIYMDYDQQAIQPFKESAYKFVKSIPLLNHNYINYEPIVITILRRNEKLLRFMKNYQLFSSIFQAKFSLPSIVIKEYIAPDNKRNYLESIEIMARSNIVICEYGSVQLNSIYMRNGSLLINLVGDYDAYTNIVGNYEYISNKFGIIYQ